MASAAGVVSGSRGTPSSVACRRRRPCQSRTVRLVTAKASVSDRQPAGAQADGGFPATRPGRAGEQAAPGSRHASSIEAVKGLQMVAAESVESSGETCSSTVYLEELPPTHHMADRAKAAMLFVSPSPTSALAGSDAARTSSDSSPRWPSSDDTEILTERMSMGLSGSEGSDMFSDRPARLTKKELLWRGIRDIVCFSLILALAGGPAGVLPLLNDGSAAIWLALQQAHTHPQIIFFTASLVPFLMFIWELWCCGKETRGVTAAFASLLVFVIAGIPLESYTESTYGDLLSNVDSIHFAAQSLVTSTNLAILLSLQDATVNAQRTHMTGEKAPKIGICADSRLLSALVATSLAGAYAAKQAGSQLVLHPADPSAVVGESALYPFLCVLIPTALGGACMALASCSEGSQSTTERHQQQVVATVRPLEQGLWAAAGLLAAAAILAPWGGPEFIPEPSNALSIPTWSVHALSILEWSVAMALVWQYGIVTRQPKWKGLSWAMLPLHGSGLCAVVFHLWYNNPSLEWLISLQAFLTLTGNTTCWWAAREIRQATARSPALQPHRSSDPKVML